MNAEIVATSQNIENIMSMLTKLENIKDDSSKLRGISLDNTGWEGMDASSFNTALSNFTQKLDKTTDDIEEALKEYKSKQEEQLELLFSAESKAKTLIEAGDEKTKEESSNNSSSQEQNSSSESLEEYEQKQQNELKDMLKTYYDNKKSSLSIAYDVNVESVLKDKLRDDMNRNPGNNITDKQINEIINKYGTDGFSDDEVKQIWDEYYAKG